MAKANSAFPTLAETAHLSQSDYLRYHAQKLRHEALTEKFSCVRDYCLREAARLETNAIELEDATAKAVASCRTRP